MELKDKNIILTGAAGGIGSSVAYELMQQGANLALLDRDARTLASLAEGLDNPHSKIHTISVDLLDSASRQQSIMEAEKQLGHIDILINAAGLMSYRPFAEEDPVLLERIMQLNCMAPMLMTRQLLPSMLQRGSGQIVNIGSTFGSIAFAWFSAYSASKFALRGFSEALRRELGGTGISVTYIAPRAVRTKLNSEAVYRMAEATGMNMDSPDHVAQQIVKAISAGRKDVYLGFPESWFVRINALFPRLVDSVLRKQNAKMHEFAKEQTS